MAAGTAGAAPPATAATSALTAEETAIYKVILKSLGGSDSRKQVLNQRLGPAPSSATPDYAACAKGLSLEKQAQPPGEKTLTGGAFSGLQLVDARDWPPAGPRSLWLVSLSRISFSADHRDALVSYSAMCDVRCGAGWLLHLHRAGTAWAISRQCGAMMF